MMFLTRDEIILSIHYKDGPAPKSNILMRGEVIIHIVITLIMMPDLTF